MSSFTHGFAVLTVLNGFVTAQACFNLYIVIVMETAEWKAQNSDGGACLPMS